MMNIGPTFFSGGNLECNPPVGFWNDSGGAFTFSTATTSPKSTAQKWLGESSALFLNPSSFLYKSVFGVDTFDLAKINIFGGDFSIQAMVYPTAVIAQVKQIFSLYVDSGLSSPLIDLTHGHTDKLRFFTYGGSGVDLSSVANLNQNAWNSVAITRSGTTWSLWLNGVAAATVNGTNINVQPRSIAVGRYFHGYIDHIRLSNEARLTHFGTPYPVNDPRAIVTLEFEDTGVCSPKYQPT